ncbi:molybdate ABC transporter substrate-binding protein [Methanococcoides methylutens]|uniref:Molybdate ABC transporter substrate-binding protein n=1 Tax=Methanococcoides methylutens TaxID=2226 RepID=A0A099T452_METMT|nr:molybdate ABC transporter substrate-binding protein [Methanococcoides methylutens]KGK99604.1 molybdate ABC transporter substrate-binding protein [Methanococcoides methylutens]
MEKNHLIIVIAAVILVAAAAMLVMPSSQAEENTEITVSAAASLTESFTEIEQEFEAQNPDVNVNMNFAGSGSLRMQIEAGAPIDVFASASQKHMNILEEGDLIDTDTRHDFAENSLVMIVPASDEDEENRIMSLENLTDSSVKKIAIGDPEVAPVGRYAKGSIEEASLWDDVSEKLIYAETVKQVLVYVENGEVDAGFVYMTDAMTSDMDEIKIVAEIPVTTSISYPIATISSSTEKEASREFIDFVVSDEGKAIFEKYGFTVTDAN